MDKNQVSSMWEVQENWAHPGSWPPAPQALFPLSPHTDPASGFPVSHTNHLKTYSQGTNLLNGMGSWTVHVKILVVFPGFSVSQAAGSSMKHSAAE